MAKVSDARVFPAEAHARNLLAVPTGPDDALRMVGPFAMVGLHGKREVAPGALPVDADVRPHPHIGLAAITYMIEGHITHRDSLGHRRELEPGSAGLTVAGHFVVHSERYERLRLLGGDLELLQMLLALPEAHEEIEPRFDYVAAADLPTERGAGTIARWLSDPSGTRGALRLPMPTLLVDVEVEAGASWSLPSADERAAFVLRGTVRVGDVLVAEGQLARLEAQDEALVADGHARVLVVGGAAIGRRYMWWNYLHSSLARIEEAKAAWRAGTAKLPVGDTESFTPAPPDEGRPLRTLNG